MEDPNRSYCRYCEGHTDTYHLMAGLSMCSICGCRKSSVPSLHQTLDWLAHWEESGDPMGVDEELRRYEEGG